MAIGIFLQVDSKIHSDKKKHTIEQFSSRFQPSTQLEIDDYEMDDCNMCGGAGFLDLECLQACPNCKCTGQVKIKNKS